MPVVFFIRNMHIRNELHVRLSILVPLFFAAVYLLNTQSVTAQCLPEFILGKTIYENPLSSKEDIKGVVLETGREVQPEISFMNGRMQLKSEAHFLMWFPLDFPDNIAVSWDFMPKTDDGLAMFWFCATGRRGEDLFDRSLAKRTGNYPQYHTGDINAYHLAYFRRNPWDDPQINTVNLRKSHGNRLVAQGADPIPNVEVEKVRANLKDPYKILVIKAGGYIRMMIDDLLIFDWKDDEPYTRGKIGFRQMANLVAEYSNLKVRKVEVFNLAGEVYETPAFPGAEGYGRFAKGGRGGDVYYVTNLNDAGPGSLRHGIVSAIGPRTILFKVSGIIELESPLIINKPYITIAGQTAPGDGICIKNYQTSISSTHDIIIRHMRFRPGDEVGRRQVAEGAKGWETDALSAGKSNNIIIDHCSTGWANDEILSLTQVGLHNITVQWTMITEALNNSTHPKGRHGYGSIVGGHATGTQPRITMHHNLYAHNWARNPHFAGDREGNPPGSITDFRNNVIYDWGQLASHNNTPQYTSVNYVNNYLKPGPSTPDEQRTIGLTTGSKNAHFYAVGNHITSMPEADKDNWAMANTGRGATPLDKPLLTPPVHTVDAFTAYKQVLKGAGAFPRDAVDSRVVEQVRTGTGRIIDSANDVGGWPDYRSSKAPIDTDNDGMPDTWEIERGLDPRNPADGNADRNGNGYTNLEEYLHWAHLQVLIKSDKN